MSFSRLLVAALLSLLQCSALTAINSDIWDHFVFAQQWPMTACIDATSTHEHKCGIADNVTTWTVHGLWPSEKSSQGPQFCNVSQHELDFDPTSLYPILGQLLKFWPNLYLDTEKFSFWKHEWCKHGTCAITLDALNSELKYFQKGLDLRTKFDLLSILSTAGIRPSDETTYEYTEFISALTKGLGAEPKLTCVYDRGTKTQYIAQIEFCISKAFEIIDCPTKQSGPLFFLPNVIDLQLSGKIEHAIVMKQKQSDGPESCEPYFVKKLSRESPCRDTETIAFPVTKHF